MASDTPQQAFDIAEGVFHLFESHTAAAKARLTSTMHPDPTFDSTEARQATLLTLSHYQLYDIDHGEVVIRNQVAGSGQYSPWFSIEPCDVRYVRLTTPPVFDSAKGPLEYGCALKFAPRAKSAVTA